MGKGDGWRDRPPFNPPLEGWGKEAGGGIGIHRLTGMAWTSSLPDSRTLTFSRASLEEGRVERSAPQVRSPGSHEVLEGPSMVVPVSSRSADYRAAVPVLPCAHKQIDRRVKN